MTEITEFSETVFRPALADETILRSDETISRFWRRRPETAFGYPFDNKTADSAPASKTGDGQMRTLSFMLAFAFVLAGSSIAGSADNGLPGVGTFAYSGPPVGSPASHSIVVAAR